jgi:hypothetical protein
MAKRQMSMLSFIPDLIKKSKVEENQSHHAYDRDDKRKIKSEWFSQFQWLQHKDSMFFCQVCIDRIQITLIIVTEQHFKIHLCAGYTVESWCCSVEYFTLFGFYN